MQILNIHETKTHFSKLIERVTAGETIIISKAGVPVAKLVSYHEDDTPRKPGFWKDRVVISPDFDELPPEISAAFHGDLL
jgi:prevent-host-death family protein